eukprot:10498299-Alexandrium_andersonii.AAC.1
MANGRQRLPLLVRRCGSSTRRPLGLKWHVAAGMKGDGKWVATTGALAAGTKPRIRTKLPVAAGV